MDQSPPAAASAAISRFWRQGPSGAGLPASPRSRSRWLRQPPRHEAVRDCLHPHDLVPLLEKQLAAPKLAPADRLVNLSGGVPSALSLRQLTDWCGSRFGAHQVAGGAASRPFDLPWVVLDHAKATRLWDWRPLTPVDSILDEIATHAQAHPDWLDLSAAF